MLGWLKDDNGVRVPLDPGGVLVGRALGSHVVVDDPQVSRRHLLVLPAGGRAQILVLGRRPVTLAGRVIDGVGWASNGDELVVEGARFRFELPAVERPTGWVLSLRGRQYAVRARGMTIGGDPSDDLSIDGWPPTAVRLLLVEGGMLADTHASVRVDGAEAADGAYFLTAGSVLTCGADAIQVVEAVAADRTTGAVGVEEIALEFVPNGALLRVVTTRPRHAWLPQKRADLVAALLRPAPPLRPGEWVEDAVLVPRIWGSTGATREQLNTLIHRTRISLSEAGLNGPALIERAPGGGATRMSVGSTTRVSVA
ncbi:MAG: FHA domain-containing protein [Polyangiaceae bacterium]